MVIPNSMINYEERKILGGLIHLRRYDRMDMLFGLWKDIERDLVISFTFTICSIILILSYILGTTKD